MKKQLLYLVLTMTVWYSSNAQDPIFSQFYKSHIYMNPAASGLEGGLVITAVSREQWGRILGNSPLPGVFSTQFASVDWTSSSLKNGVSAFFMNDVEGDANLQTQYGGLNYAYVLPVQKWHGLHNFRLGFGLYYSKKMLAWDRLLFSDQLHPKGEEYFLPVSNHTQYYDQFRENPPWWTGLNMGVLYRYSENNSLGNGKELSLGVNATHLLNLLSPTSFESLQSIGTGLDMKFSMQGSAFFPLLKFGPKGNKFTPIFNGRMDFQGGISAFTFGSDLLFKNIGLGLYYQNTFANTIVGSTDALIVMYDMAIPFQNGQSIELGLSYDINLNGLRSYTGGVLELVVKYRITKLSNKIICPPVSSAHRARWENVFYKNQKNKNTN